MYSAFTSLPLRLIGEVPVSANPAARNLGCGTLDEAIDMEAHVHNISRVCYYHLHNISATLSSLTAEATEKVIHAFITSRMDNCNALLYHLPSNLIARLQRKRNSC